MAATVGTAISKRLFGRDAMTSKTDADADASVPAMPATLSDDAAAFLRRRVEAATADGDLHPLLVANAQLRGQVEDLTGALKARDMEIAALRERCAFLAKAMEQQDETIAKIYAAASLDTELPTHVEEKKKTPLADTKTKTKTQKSPPSEKRIQAATTTSSVVLTEAIDRLLNPRTEKEKENQKTNTKTEFSRPLFAEAQEDEEDPLDDTAPSSCSSTLSSKSSSTRSFERRESSASEEDFARSAGFLRRPSRRTGSARLSISDFGLLDTADDEQEQEEEGEEDGTTDNQELSRSKSEDLLVRSKRRRSSSVRSLFEDPIDTAKTRSANKPPPSNNTENAAEEEEEEMTYAEFLERLRQPASRDLLETVRQFVASVVGPRGDGKPPRATDFADYDFYGTHEFRRRCTRFFQGIDELLLNHTLWRHASEATLTKARDGVEKYVMDKLSSIAMDQLDECEHWREEDARLMRRMQLLAFVTPDMLEIKPCMRNEVVWSMAEDELRRINSFRCPGDKINCIVRCCSIIFSVLNLTRGDAGSRPGADDFLPVFIYIVLHAKIPRLYANCEYIANYRNPNDLMSKAGYCFVNLRSALEFISVVDASMLKISDDDFNRLYCEQERRLEPIME